MYCIIWSTKLILCLLISRIKKLRIHQKQSNQSLQEPQIINIKILAFTLFTFFHSYRCFLVLPSQRLYFW